ncbi:hypothetical protein [Rhodosalinus sp.]|uniref:hypothetical protein n=1 Tax=Rhodosalinus sp. TaxID=2047741 RepID=UPI003563EE53
MRKLLAIVNVIAWSGFWAFGYLALAAEGLTATQVSVAALIAFAGLMTGVGAWIRIARMAEETGDAPRSGPLPAEVREAAQAKWEDSDALP